MAKSATKAEKPRRCPESREAGPGQDGCQAGPGQGSGRRLPPRRPASG